MKLTVKEASKNGIILGGRRGLRRCITSPQLAKPDLFRPGPWQGIESSAVHLPPSQLAHLASLAPARRRQVIRMLFKQKPACLVLTGGLAPDELVREADRSGVVLFRSRSASALIRLLLETLTPRTSLHGVLVQIFGLGTLIIGESAIGKSEAALDLVLRGHKLTADDIVMLQREEGSIRGEATPLGADLLQIRGLGIIDIRALFGEPAIASASPVGLVVELEEWRQGKHYSLVGLRERRYRILGVNIPYLKLPVKTGRNIATLIEVAARNQMLKNRGIYSARELQRRLVKRLTK